VSDQETIARLLSAINEAWRAGHAEDLAQVFADEMVLEKPGFTGRIEGREACAKSYGHFMDNATVMHFEAAEPTVDVWGDTAVASYSFEIEYKAGGPVHRESGRDVFVFTRHEGRWQAVWRTVVPLPTPE
jgi:uncharacterized protein (TIGR02246 family)